MNGIAQGEDCNVTAPGLEPNIYEQFALCNCRDLRPYELTGFVLAGRLASLIFVHRAIGLGHQVLDRITIVILEMRDADADREIIRPAVKLVADSKLFLQAMRH